MVICESAGEETLVLIKPVKISEPIEFARLKLIQFLEYFVNWGQKYEDKTNGKRIISGSMWPFVSMSI